jgi:transcriptional regulator with XRE-family HTH domain
MRPGSQQPTGLGNLVERRRDELGLSMREAARRIGISPAYLLAIEHGRNPSTGRPPVPSASVLVRIAGALDVDPATLLAASEARTPSSSHVLLYQTGSGHRSPLDAARSLCASRVDAWIEIVDPRRPGDDASRPDDVLSRRTQPLLSPHSGAGGFEVDRILGPLAETAELRLTSRPQRLGVIFGASSAVLRSVENPQTLLASEKTWERDVGDVFRVASGDAPRASVCVYRETDLQELAPRLDPLSTVLSLIRSHPVVAVHRDDGVVTTGPAAIETIVLGASPSGVSSETWQLLSRAAAVGLSRHAEVGSMPLEQPKR